MCLREILFMYLCLGFVELIGSLDRQSRQFQKKFWPLFLHFFFVPLRHFSFSSETPISCKLCYLKFFFSVLMPCSFYFQCFFPPLCFNFQFLLIYLEVYYFFFSKCLFSVNPRRMSFSYQRFYFLPLEVWFGSFYTFWVSLQYIQPFLQHLGYMRYSHNNCFTILIY